MPHLFASLLPDSILLKTIQKQNAYFHKNSKEQTTGVIKSKYKLAGNILQDFRVYIFFILTSHSSSCDKRTTLKIKKCDWENRKQKHLGGVGYLDVKKVETLDEKEIITKLKANEFYCVARLSDDKFIQLNDLCKKARCQTSTPDKNRSILQIAVSDKIEELDRLEVAKFIDTYNI
ncbi:MAG TPA: hypothetical protein PKL13_04170 [bacterium]|nr:hypothetical protein [bacterium]